VLVVYDDFGGECVYCLILVLGVVGLFLLWWVYVNGGWVG